MTPTKEKQILEALEAEHELLLDKFSSTDPEDSLQEEMSRFRGLCEIVALYAAKNNFADLKDWARRRDSYWGRRQYGDAGKVIEVTPDDVSEAYRRFGDVFRTNETDARSKGQFSRIGQENLALFFETTKAIAEVWLDCGRDLASDSMNAYGALTETNSNEEVMTIQRRLMFDGAINIVEGLKRSTEHANEMTMRILENSEAALKGLVNGHAVDDSNVDPAGTGEYDQMREESGSSELEEEPSPYRSYGARRVAAA